jgi:hypothetical protein
MRAGVAEIEGAAALLSQYSEFLALLERIRNEVKD